MTTITTSFDAPAPQALPENPVDARRAIARDVLAQLAVRRLRASHCYFYPQEVAIDTIPGLEHATEVADCDARTALTATGYCEVCAIGAALVGYIGLYNGLTFQDAGMYRDGRNRLDAFTDRLAISKALIHVWPHENLRQMEIIYEQYGQAQNEGDHAGWWDEDETIDLDDRERMAAIFQNVLESEDALFDPSRRATVPALPGTLTETHA